MTKSKKNHKTTLMIAFFFGFVFLMVVLRPRTKEGITYVKVPDNKGFPKLSSTENELIALESGGGFYLFDWSGLEDDYAVFPSLSQHALFFDQTPKISLSWTRGNLVALTADGNEQFRITNDDKVAEAHLLADRHQKHILLIGSIEDDERSFYSVKEVQVRDKRLSYIYDLGLNQPLKLRAFAVSDDGSKLAAAGQNEGRGYIAVVDINARNMAWEKQFSDVTDFSGICISSDGQTVFAGSADGTLSMIDIRTGESLKTVVLVSRPRETTKSRTIQTVTASPGGRWIACACDPEVFVLDQATCTLSKTMSSPHKIVTGIAFSPDDTQLATSDLRASGIINIVDLDNNNAQ